MKLQQQQLYRINQLTSLRFFFSEGSAETDLTDVMLQAMVKADETKNLPGSAMILTPQPTGKYLANARFS